MSIIRAKRMTAADIDSIVNLIRDRLLTAIEDSRDILIQADAGIRDIYKTRVMITTYEPDGRFSVEIHIGGGVDSGDHERHRTPR
jgi:hypothetical protein